MAMFDFLTGTKRPASGTAPLGADEVRKRCDRLERDGFAKYWPF